MLDGIRSMVLMGATFMDVVEALRRDNSFVLTPLNLIRALKEALNIPMVDIREMFEMFDADLYPIVSVAEINERGESLFVCVRVNSSNSDGDMKS